MLGKGTILYIYAETPLHPGSGTELGTVDLPVQREKHTGFPIVQASGLKGVLRDAARATTEANKAKDEDFIRWVFGPDEGADHAGALSVGDARILLFPVRSLKGIFAWTTCPLVLHRFRKDLSITQSPLNDWKLPDHSPADTDALVTDQSALIHDSALVLEEYTFKATKDKNVTHLAKWLAQVVLPQNDEYKYWRDKMQTSLVVLPDDAFRDFARYYTMVVSRTRIRDATKTVDPGGLWTEEHLPPETVLYAPIFASAARWDKDNSQDKEPPEELRKRDGVLKWLTNLSVQYIRLGGDETVGRGLARIQFGDRKGAK